MNESDIIDNSNSEALKVLCCPMCKGDLKPDKNIFSCLNCNAKYQFDGRMFKFLTSTDDQFTEEEHSLFQKMKSPKENYISEQWEKSKEHFIGVATRSIGNCSERSILHVGCGVDRFRDTFSDCRLYFSLDITEEMLMDIKISDGHGNSFIVNANIEALPFKDNSFDSVLCIDLIHHFSTRGIHASLREIVRVMKSDGNLFLEEINKYAFYRLPYCFVPHSVLLLLREVKGLFNINYTKPARYEAPLSVFNVLSVLSNLYRELKGCLLSYNIVPVKEYPNVPESMHKVFMFIGNISPLFFKHAGFHWFIATECINKIDKKRVSHD